MVSKPPPPEDRRVYDVPLHVVPGADGTVIVFFPDGHRMEMTAGAAERSGAILWRTGVRTSVRARPPARPWARQQGQRTGEVIAVDFTPH
jgi:hypothetical protein